MTETFWSAKLKPICQLSSHSFIPSVSHQTNTTCEMDSYLLFRGTKRLHLRPDDLSLGKISLIFKVQESSIFLLDDHNQVFLPSEDGIFDQDRMVPGGHYEVNGDATEEDGASRPSASPQVQFAFRRPSSTPFAAGISPRPSGPKMMQKSILIADIIDGKPVTSRAVTVKFSEFEATVPSISTKVNEALGQESLILVDSQGNQLVDSDGTRGSAFWRQHARKVFAVPEAEKRGCEATKEGEKATRLCLWRTIWKLCPES
ncbi:uncharacterized protein LOC121697813 isoform X1 [Alosa sapidissima]|uniref:uncharacterized protein LOC121697813 isoform X1 n=2 Tax=Alosa sapidissima TaxID=34773 RepID=UPI001C084953|nr:uncharacterized protein LOC121697813 isoform X1 [Alosa sapidissima]